MSFNLLTSKNHFFCSNDAIFLSRADIGGEAGAETGAGWGAADAAGGSAFFDLLRIDFIRSLAAVLVLGVLFCLVLAKIFSIKLTDFC